MANSIKCPKCQHVHTTEVLYPMSKRFNIQRDEIVLECLNCKEEFLFGYSEYYDILINNRRTK